MTAPYDLDRQLDAFLLEGPTELPDVSFDAVRDRTEQTRQRVVLGPWRVPEMNKLIPIGLGAAAVVVALFVGARLLGPPPSGPGTATTPEPTATIAPSEAAPSVEPTSPAAGGLPEGPFVVFDPTTQQAPFDEGIPITVTIAGPGWTSVPQFGALTKGDQEDPPEGAGAGLLTGDPGAGGFYVYGDPCHWESTTPDTPATTVDQLVEALAAQQSRDASAPVDVTVGGYAGKSITLHVPNIAPTRAEAFKDCDRETFATFGVEGIEGPARYQQGPGQVDQLWIVDVDGEVVVLDLTYGPATPTELIEEGRALAESATFEPIEP